MGVSLLGLTLRLDPEAEVERQLIYMDPPTWGIRYIYIYIYIYVYVCLTNYPLSIIHYLLCEIYAFYVKLIRICENTWPHGPRAWPIGALGRAPEARGEARAGGRLS